MSDERTNRVLVSGEKSQRLKLRTLVAHLDTPLEAGGDLIMMRCERSAVQPQARSESVCDDADNQGVR